MAPAAPVEVVPGVWRLGGWPVNWYVVEGGGGGLTIVDAGLPGWAARLEEDLRAIGHSVEDVEAVILTHSDDDHTGLAGLLQERVGARVLIHPDDDGELRRSRPKTGDARMMRALALLRHKSVRRFFKAMVGESRGAKVPKVGLSEGFMDGALLDVPGRPRVVATPGHTNGHCAFVFETHGVVMVGDELCTWNPKTEATGPQSMPSGVNVSDAECTRSLDVLAAVEASWVLPGHGDPWQGSPAEAAQAARRADFV